MSTPESAPSSTPAADSGEKSEFRQRMLLQMRARAGINWFYWVAGLTIINAIIFVAGNTPNYFLGLGLAQLVDSYTVTVATGTEMAPLMRWVAGAINLLLAGVFIIFGFRGQRGYRSWIVAGIVLYTLDGLISLFFSVWLGVLFHAFVIYKLVQGMRAMDELNQMGPPAPRAPDGETRQPASSEPA